MTYPLVARPVPVSRSAVFWWSAFTCWFVGSALGQVAHDSAALGYDYRYAGIEPGPLAVTLFAIAAVFLASLVLPMRDGARWSRVALTVLAGPMAAVLVWQAILAVHTDPVTPADTAQTLLCLVALGALAGAVNLMYRPETRRYYRRRRDHVR